MKIACEALCCNIEINQNQHVCGIQIKQLIGKHQRIKLLINNETDSQSSDTSAHWIDLMPYTTRTHLHTKTALTQYQLGHWLENSKRKFVAFNVKVKACAKNWTFKILRGHLYFSVTLLHTFYYKNTKKSYSSCKKFWSTTRMIKRVDIDEHFAYCIPSSREVPTYLFFSVYIGEKYVNP